MCLSQHQILQKKESAEKTARDTVNKSRVRIIAELLVSKETQKLFTSRGARLKISDRYFYDNEELEKLSELELTKETYSRFESLVNDINQTLTKFGWKINEKAWFSFAGGGRHLCIQERFTSQASFLHFEVIALK